ncbi:hypothetical protein BpHYR1_022343 [Brachionus plicatilis]|uniref:Uncharacterized protein n=1 Tax=Brachionus plicatilis TaxID=10195 RepID=A0A3M7T2P4_BRAPC|nr:hypothetical protein BpHYR1_022343 [Brachionus plicatilis]
MAAAAAAAAAAATLAADCARLGVEELTGSGSLEFVGVVWRAVQQVVLLQVLHGIEERVGVLVVGAGGGHAGARGRVAGQLRAGLARALVKLTLVVAGIGGHSGSVRNIVQRRIGLRVGLWCVGRVRKRVRQPVLRL